MSRPKSLVLSFASLDEAGKVIGPAVGGAEEATRVTVDAYLVGATGGTLDVYIQRELSVGVDNWADWIHFTQVAAGGAAVNYTIDCAQCAEAVPIAVGTGTASTTAHALAAGKVAASLPNGRVRMVLVTGASTSSAVTPTVRLTCRYD